jgi:putative hydrolase of HD superfamily
MDAKAIINFMREAEKLKSTLRHNWSTGGRQESSAEHTWRATLLATIIIEELGLSVDLLKVIKMLLIHDIPEIAYGDIPGWDKADRENRKKREKDNAQNIFNTLPVTVAQEFNSLYNEFEEGVSLESKIGHAIEKIESQLQHLESGPEYWNEEETGEHMINYPNKALDSLGNKDIDEFWDIIRKEIIHITNTL